MGTYKQLFVQGQPFSYDLVELGKYYLQYQRLMDHSHEVLPARCLTFSRRMSWHRRQHAETASRPFQSKLSQVREN